MLMGFLRDLRYAVRQLRKSPGFALTAMLTLAFGIGATTAIFSIVEGVLLRPLPFADPGRLVSLGDQLEGVPYDTEERYVTAPEIGVYMRDTRAFAALGGYEPLNFELAGSGQGGEIAPVRVNAARMTASVFPTLGVGPLMGRAFTQAEDEGAQPVAVLSYEAWKSRFQGGAGVLGQKIQLDRKPYEIIGVMPREFEFPLTPGHLGRSELWVPMSLTQAELKQGAGAWTYEMVGRLKPGVTAAQAQQDAVPATEEIMRNLPPALARRKIHPAVEALDEVTVSQGRPLVRMLFLAVTVVLLIACANLAGLLLVRVIRRRREIAVRLALGATTRAVLRQPLAEALVLSVGGGVIGLALAAVALRVGVSYLPETLPRVSSIGLDWPVMGFALGLAVLTGLLCGLLPAFAATRTGVNEALKEGGRSGSTGAGHGRLRSLLVVAELAVALVLLVCSGLLLRSFEKMRATDLGFRPDGTLTATYGLPRENYTTQAQIDAFNTGLRAKLEALPGVEAVGVTTMLPASGAEGFGTFTAEGYVPPKGAGLNLGWVAQVMGDYFKAQGIALVRGRGFTAADDQPGAPLVVVVNRKLAEHYWPGQDPIGKRMHRGPAEATGLPWMTVVGEIGDVKQEAADGPTANQFYLATSQTKAAAGSFAPAGMLMGLGGSIVMRGQMPPEQMKASVLAVVRSLDPELPVTDVASMEQVVADGQAPRRFNTAVISAFAGSAVLLALMGIYSVIAFSTALRTQEMAIRLALGSKRWSVMRLILLSGAKLGLAGCVLGGIAAVFATRLLSSLLFEVDALDPVILGLAGMSIVFIAIAASVLPAGRAARTDPMRALRYE
jgi:putative ABC transport system permease protein